MDLSIYVLGKLDKDKTEKDVLKTLKQIQKTLKNHPLDIKVNIVQHVKEIEKSVKGAKNAAKELGQILTKAEKLNFNEVNKQNLETVTSIDEVIQKLSQLGAVNITKNINPATNAIESFTAQVKQASGETQKLQYVLTKNLQYSLQNYQLIDKSLQRIKGLGVRIADVPEGIIPTKDVYDYRAIEKYISSLDQLRNKTIETIRTTYDHKNEIYTTTVAVKRKTGELDQYVFKLDRATNALYEYNRVSRDTIQKGLGVRIADLPKGIIPTKDVYDYRAIENYISSLDQLKNKTIETIRTTYDHKNGIYTTTVAVKRKTGELDKYVFKLDRATNALYEYSRVPRAIIQKDVELFHQLRIALQRIPLWFFGMTLFMRPIYSFREGIQGIIEMDSAMTQLRRVANATAEELKAFHDTAYQMGVELGVQAAEVVRSTAAWAQLGYTLKEAQALARETSIFATVGDITAEQASQYLISTIRGFQIEVDETGESVRRVVDIFNEVGNNFAVSSAGIGEAMLRSASALQTAGNTIEEAVALIAAANAIVQDPVKVGTALKTVSLRLRGVTDEGEEVANLIPKLEEQFNQIGLTLKKDENTFKSTYEIFKDLSEVWNELTDIQQANILELVAGKEQANVVAGLLINFQDAIKAYEVAQNSAGSATKEFEASLNSFQTKISEFTNTVQLFWSNAINNDGAKALISFATEIVNLLAKIVEHIGGVSFAAFVATNALIALFGKGRNVLNIFSEMIPVIARKRDALETTIKAVDTGTQSIRLLGFELNALGVQANIARVKLLALQAAASIGLGVAVGALTFGVSYLITKWMEHRNEIEENRKRIADLAETYVRNKQEIDGLINKYEELSRITKQGTVFRDEEQQQEYLETQNRLAELLPVVVKGIDEQGNVRLKNIDAIKEEVRLLEEKNKQLQKEIELKQITSLEDDIKRYKDLSKEIEKLTRRLEQANVEKQNLETSDGIWYEGLWYTRTQPRYLPPPLTQEEKWKIEFDLSDLLLEFQNLKNQIEQSAAIKVKWQLEDRNIDIDDNLQTVIENFIKEINIDLNNLDESIQNITLAFSQIFNGIDDYKLKALSQTTGFTVDQLQKLKTAIDQARQANDQFDDSVNNTTDSLDTMTDTVSELYKVFTTAYDNIDKLNGIIEELNENHRLSGDSIAYILQKYPELIAFIDNENLLKQKLIEITKQESKIAQQELHNKLMVSRSYYENLIKYNSDFYKYMYDTYKVDLENYKNLAQAKAAVEDRLIQKLMGNWSRYIRVVNNQVRLTEDFWVGQMQFGGLSNPINREIIRRASRLQEELNKFYTTFNNIALPPLDLRGISLSSRASTSSSGSKSKSSGSKSKSSTKTQVEPYVIDKFKQAIEDLNLQLELSAYRQGRLSTLTNQYSQELLKQIQLLQKKQKLIQQEKKQLEKEKKSLEVQIKRTKDIEKRNELTRKLESTLDSIRQLTGEYWTIQQQINDTYYDRYSIALAKLNNELDQWNNKLAISNERLRRTEEGTKAWFKELKEQEKIINQQIKLVEKEIEQVRKLVNSDKLTARHKDELREKYRELTLELEKYKSQLYDVQKTMMDYYTKERDSLMDEIIDIYKEGYRKQLEIALDAHDKEVNSFKKIHEQKMKMLDEELEKYEEIINAKIKAIEKEQDEEDFNKQLSELQQKRLELLNKIEVLSLDDSIEARNRKHELEKELTEVENQIVELTTRRQRELRKEALREELEEVRKTYEQKKETMQQEYEDRLEQYNKEREAIQRHFENLINDERMFARLREEILKGHLDNVLKDLNIFINDVQNNMALLGESISLNFIDRINEAIKALHALNDANKSISTTVGNTTNTQQKTSSSSSQKTSSSTSSSTSNKTSTSSSSSSKSSTNNQATNTVKKTVIHTVVKGDTMWDLAKKYYGSGTLWTKIAKANPGIDPNKMQIGTKLIIPFDTGGYTGNYEGLAYLHKKELVLNAKDSANILETVRLVRDLYLKAIPRINNYRLPRQQQENKGTVIEKIELHFNGYKGNKRDAHEVTDIFIKNLRKRGVNI